MFYCDAKHSDIEWGSSHVCCYLFLFVIYYVPVVVIPCCPKYFNVQLWLYHLSRLSNVFLYGPTHETWIFEKFAFELEAFSCGFKIDCILMSRLISLNKKIVVASGTFKSFKLWSHICTPLILVSASTELQVHYSCNIVKQHWEWTPPM